MVILIIDNLLIYFSIIFQGMLSQIFLYGPLTTGIFRRTASHGTRQVKAQLDSGSDFLFDEIHIFDTAALLKVDTSQVSLFLALFCI